MIKKLFFFSIIFIFHQGFSQTDTCTGATNLTVGSSCMNSNYNIPGTFTNSMADPSCSASNRDAWYSFTTDAVTTDVTITCIGNRRLAIALYSGTCAGILTEEDCIVDANNGDATLANAAVLPNTIYYVRLIRYNSGANNMAGTICVTTSVANDLCTNATTLNCGDSNITGSTNGTTTVASGAGCGAGNNGVWYTFVGDGNQTTITSTSSGGFDHEMAISSGNCGSLTSISCQDIGLDDDIETYTFVTTNGSIYYVYIANWLSGSTDTGDFTISRTCNTVTPPPNDDCSGATPLTVNTPCSFSTQTNEFATDSSVADPGCAGYAGADVWFSVIVPASGNFVIDTDTGDIFDGGMAIYSGTCAALTLIECDDDDSDNGFMPSISLTGRTPGETIYIRFWEYGNDNQGTFSICVSEPAPAPANDEPCNADMLTANGICINTSGSISNATNSGIDACGGTPNNDVWYVFQATATTHTINISNVTGNTTDMYHSVYGPFASTDCSVVVGDNLNCSDGDSSVTNGLTIGSYYFVQVFTWSSATDATSTFDICITEPCLISAPPLTTLACPIVDITPDTGSVDSCGSVISSVDLTATYTDLGDTSDYDIDLITFNTTSFNNFAAAATNPVTLASDDRWSDISYAIPFDFCFYDSTVTDFVVGANGVISFDTNLSNTASGYSFNDNLPSTNGALFENAIYSAYQDIDPSVGGTITYGTTSVNGCNALVILWDNIPLFANGNFGSNTKRHTAMIVMYEYTNIIEVHIEEKVVDDGPWNGGNAIVGIQNQGATDAVVAPCRNSLDDNWATTNEAWRFTPAGTSISNLQWLVNGTLEPAYNGQTTISVSPIATTTYTAQVTYNLCNSTTLIITDDAIVSTGGGKIWDGSETTNDWMEPLNWSDNAIPTSSDCVIIPVTGNDPVIYSNDTGDGLNLSILTGATLTIQSDASVTIQDFVDIQGTSTFQLDNGASLIQVNNVVNTGNITLERTTNIRLTDYVYWSSPTINFSVFNISPATPAGYILQWNPSFDRPNGPPPTNVPNDYGRWETATGNMSLGKGYIIRGPNGHPTTPANYTATFTGTPNNGDIISPIFRGINISETYFDQSSTQITPEDDNWNLIGNPYPSAIDAIDFLTTNGNIDGVVYLWTHGTEINTTSGDPFYDDYFYNYEVADYIAYNQTGTSTPASFDGNIASGQGFFVLMNEPPAPASSSSTVSFNNTMRQLSPSYNNSQFYRVDAQQNDNNTVEKHRIWLDMITPSGKTNTTLVGYIEAATNTRDRMYDAVTTTGEGLNLYTLIDDEAFIIQGKETPFVDSDTVPLGVNLTETGIYSIAINALDGLFLSNQQIYIEDKLLNSIHNLKNAPYVFTSNQTETINDRFELRYTNETLGVNALDGTDGISIIAPNSAYIKVTSEIGIIDTITIYDIVGRVVFKTEAINQSEFILKQTKFSDGTYIVKAKLFNEKQKIQKVVLNQ
jgi:hypothetical protein